MTICGKNFGFDKTENFKASMVTVEVAGASCKLSRQENSNRYACVLVKSVFGDGRVNKCCPCVLLHWPAVTYSNSTGSAQYLKSHLLEEKGEPECMLSGKCL